MVKGIDIFQKYFAAYSNNYVIIGGTACDILIEEAGFRPRATKDIDIILIVEALNVDFVRQFWHFIQDGNYERKEESADSRKYYRFTKPENTNFPYQLELFSRAPELVKLPEDAHLTPIPVDEDLSSLSAILLCDDYYNYLIDHSRIDNGIHLANLEALICLKAKAYLEIADRISKGSKEDRKQLNKHKNDVFRLAVMLSADSSFELNESIKVDMQAFVDTIADKLTIKAVLIEMDISNTEPTSIFQQIIKSFQLSTPVNK
jgi:hypothetical protein